MTIETRSVEGQPEWSVDWTRTQGMADDTYWVYDAPGGRLGDGELIGMGDCYEEAIENAKEDLNG